MLPFSTVISRIYLQSFSHPVHIYVGNDNHMIALTVDKRLFLNWFTLVRVTSVVEWLACWPLVPKFAGSNPAEAPDFLGEKILSMPSFIGGEVKPSVPCRRFAARKRSRHLPWKSHAVGKIGSAISRPYFLPSLIEVFHVAGRGVPLEMMGETKSCAQRARSYCVGASGLRGPGFAPYSTLLYVGQRVLKGNRQTESMEALGIFVTICELLLCLCHVVRRHIYKLLAEFITK
jgi:hypothetical protein